MEAAESVTIGPRVAGAARMSASAARTAAANRDGYKLRLAGMKSCVSSGEIAETTLYIGT